MDRRRIALRALVVIACAAPHLASAADTWIEVKSPNFTVISNAGDKTARSFAWQLEQIRFALEQGWPWARVHLSLPVTVFAVKDEPALKALAPGFWETAGASRPASILASAPDRHYLALRVDVPRDYRMGRNPFAQTYTAYSMLAIESSFSRGLPFWLVTGLSTVLGHSVLQESDLQFGNPVPEYMRMVTAGPLLPLRELFAVSRASPYFTNEDTRVRYVAQCWSLLHYMLLGDRESPGHRINDLSALLLAGIPSDVAVTQVYKDLEKLNDGYVRHVSGVTINYRTVRLGSELTAQKYPVRPLTAAESAAERAGFHVANRRLADARALLTEAMSGEATVARAYEVQGTVFDLERQTADAGRAYGKAADLGSTNFLIYDRLARIAARPDADAATLAAIQRLLARSIELNEFFPPSFSLLANVLVAINQSDGALRVAQRAAELEPFVFSHRLLVARVLSRLARNEEARAETQVALRLARTDAERAAVQTVINSISR